MGAIRQFFRVHRHAAILLLYMALAMKAVVPAGFMVDAGAKVLTVHICTDSLDPGVARLIALPFGHQGDVGHKAHADAPCPFAALGHAALGGADPVQLALALAFILALGFAWAVPARIKPSAFLRPPLRGPPAHP